MNVAFKVSDLAVEKIKDICAKEDKQGYGLRVSKDEAGCGGPKVQLGLAEKASNGDHVLETNGLKVFMDPQTAEFVNEASLDFIEDTMGGGGFKVTNPNQPEKAASAGGCACGKGSCGCGSGGCGS